MWRCLTSCYHQSIDLSSYSFSTCDFILFPNHKYPCFGTIPQSDCHHLATLASEGVARCYPDYPHDPLYIFLFSNPVQMLHPLEETWTKTIDWFHQNLGTPQLAPQLPSHGKRRGNSSASALCWAVNCPTAAQQPWGVSTGQPFGFDKNKLWFEHSNIYVYIYIHITG